MVMAIVMILVVMMVIVVMMLVMMDGDGDLMLVMMMIVMMVVIMVVIVMVIVGFAPANYEHIHGDERLYPSSVRDQSTSRARTPTIAHARACARTPMGSIYTNSRSTASAAVMLLFHQQFVSVSLLIPLPLALLPSV